MSAFRQKRLDQQTVGGTLGEQRRAKRISLEQAARATHINRAYLEALEQDDFAVLPAGVYGKRFVEEYARFLGLRARPLARWFDRERELGLAKKDDLIFGAKRVRRRDLFLLPRIGRGAILILIILLSLAYLAFRVHSIIVPPLLTVDFPPQNFTTTEQTITVTGKSEPEVRLFINTEEVVVDSSGRFSLPVNLTTGKNVITVRAQKRYGQDAEVVRQILVK